MVRAEDEETMPTRTAIAALATALFVGCTGEPKTIGHVVDVFDNPIAGAEVTVSGLDAPLTTDAHGVFTIPRQTAAVHVRAGREGFIHDEIDVEPDPDTKILLRLYPRPEETGFYLVGRDAYSKLEPVAVQAIGSNLDDVRGLSELGDVTDQTSTVRVLFHTDLKLDQIMRIDLALHQLQYTKEAPITGPLDARPVEVNVWTAAHPVDIDIKPLRSKKDYLITSKAPVDAGPYAFDTQDLLEPGNGERFSRIPEPLRVAYPFELR
jgi:hypothetical protein